MTTVTSLTADRMLAIEAASVVDGDVVGDNLILTKHDGSQINAGSVRGPTGAQGPVGQDLSILTAAPILDVGQSGQIRAGRQLTAADFTAMGLSAPLGLWNLSDLTDVSGNGRNLLNKGAVPFDGVGINGSVNTAARFIGSTAQVLYIPDTGVSDPFRIKTGSFGCWLRATKRGLGQYVMAKAGAAGQCVFWLSVGNQAFLQLSTLGNADIGLTGATDITDERWHFVVATLDGTSARLYVDGYMDGSILCLPLFSGACPFNIGGWGADGSTVTTSPHYGCIDEAFVTADVLSEDQIRNLYCAKIPHTLAAVPSRISLNVHRRRKGASLTVADFPTQPLRLYNFSGGSLGDEGSNGVALTNSSATSVAGADGSVGNSFSFAGGVQALTATDAGLPSGLSSRSYGSWFKTYSASAITLMGWGTLSTADARMWTNGPAGQMNSSDSSDTITTTMLINDGQWHFGVVVEDNNALDSIKRKLYIDGKLCALSTVMNPITLAGASHFTIGVNPGAGSSGPWVGQIDTAFVCGYALTADRIASLYSKGSQTLASSPKNVGEHVEAMTANNLLALFDSIESQNTIDLTVAP